MVQKQDEVRIQKYRTNSIAEVFHGISFTIASLYENKTDKAKKGNQIQHVRTHNSDLHITTP